MRNSNGCLANILWTVWTVFFLVIFFGTLSLRQPIGQKIAEFTVCQSGTVQYGVGKMTCLDKKTGQKTDVTLMGLFGFCPALLILVFFIIISVIVSLILKRSRAVATARSNFTRL